MGTRRWVVALEVWMRREGWTKEKLAKHSIHNEGHVLSLFKEPDPNPSLALYLELLTVVGARLNGVQANEPRAVVDRLKEIVDRENIMTITALAKAADVNRSQLSSLFNQKKQPNPTLAVIDRLVTALGAEQELTLVSLTAAVVNRAIEQGAREIKLAEKTVTMRHLYALTSSPPAPEAIAAVRAEVDAKSVELQLRIDQLRQANLALEKRRADDAAEIARLEGTNKQLELLRAQDAEEIAQLKTWNEELKRENLAAIRREKSHRFGYFMTGWLCMVGGIGIGVAMKQHGRRKH